MIISGSLITINGNSGNDVEHFVNQYPEIEIHTRSEDGCQLVVTIETADDQELERLSSIVKAHTGVLDIAHHYFHFEEEVEVIRCGSKKPELSRSGGRYQQRR